MLVPAENNQACQDQLLTLSSGLLVLKTDRGKTVINSEAVYLTTSSGQ